MYLTGGGDKGGGGGARFIKSWSFNISLSPSTGYPITIGGGGGGSPQPSPGTPLLGVPGCNSVAVIGGVTLTATGGGRGGGTGDTAGDPGGSGGGGGFHDVSNLYNIQDHQELADKVMQVEHLMQVHITRSCGSGAGGGGGAGAVGGNAPSSKPNTRSRHRWSKYRRITSFWIQTVGVSGFQAGGGQKGGADFPSPTVYLQGAGGGG